MARFDGPTQRRYRLADVIYWTPYSRLASEAFRRSKGHSSIGGIALLCEWRLNFLPHSGSRSRLGRLHCTSHLLRLITHHSVLVTLVGLIGCAPRQTRFDIVDHRAGAEATHYFESFNECYYSIDSLGRIDLVARRISVPEAERQDTVTQVVHLHGVWRAVPGRTFADDSMINATVSYLIVTGREGASFEGGGFVSFTEDRAKTTAAGKLEVAKLAPKRRLGDGEQLFDRAELTGEFKAARDPRRVVRILNEMRHLFGPLPRYEPPPVENDLL